MSNTAQDTDLSSADLAGMGLGDIGDVEPTRQNQPANPEGTGVPDVETGKPAATTTPASAPAVTPAKPAAASKPDDDPSTIVDRLLSSKQSRTQSRDYSGLDEREKKIFERMSNEAYTELYPIYKQFRDNKSEFERLPELKKELESLKAQASAPKSYVDHEHAYLLSADYQGVMMERANAERVRDFWHTQLNNIESGKPFKILQIRQNADGTQDYVPSQDIDPKADGGRATVLQQLMQANTALTAAEGRMQQTVSQIKNRNQLYTAAGNELRKKYFGKQEAILKPQAEKFLSTFHADYRSHPAMQFAAYALAALAEAMNDRGTEAVKAAAEAANSAAARVAGPTAADNHAGSAGKPVQFSDKEFKEFKGQYGI